MGKNVSNAKTFLEKRFEGQISGENIETGKLVTLYFLAQVEFFPVLTPIEILVLLSNMETSASNVELQLHQHFISYSLSNATANAVLAERNIKDHCQKSQSVFTSTLMRSSGIEKKNQ
uniref:Uncharacterized protein n=1 Tax=Salix viminalis TaxID=40686 RepID=A0A6N2LUH0_SALVM